MPRYWEVFGSADTWRICTSGIAGLVLGEVAYFRALTKLGPRLSLMCWSTSPGATVLVTYLWMGRSPTWFACLGICLTVVGVSIALIGRRRAPETRFRARLDGTHGQDDATGEGIVHGGLVWAVIGPLFLGVSFAALGEVGTTDAPMAAHGLRFVAAALPLAVLTVATGGLPRIIGAFRDRKRAGLLVAAVVSGTLVGSALATYSVLTTDAATAITLSSLGPIMILPITRFTETRPLTLATIVGAVVAVLGAAAVAWG